MTVDRKKGATSKDQEGDGDGREAGRRTVIEARDLTKVYGRGENRVEALAGVSRAVEPGGWVSLIGPSGSGKSTLMNLLDLLDRPTYPGR